MGSSLGKVRSLNPWPRRQWEKSPERCFLRKSIRVLCLIPNQAIADAAHRKDMLGVAWICFQFFAQVTDVNIHRPAFAEEIGPPDLGEELVAGKDAIRLAGHGGKQFK